MLTNRSFGFAFGCLLFASVSWADEAPTAARGQVVCAQDPRCLADVSSALETAKTNKNEALRQMMAAYAQFPDPRLCFNLGRLFQQTGDLREAIVNYRQFLDAEVESNPDLRAKAQSFLEQAEKDSVPAPPAVPDRLPTLLAPVPVLGSKSLNKDSAPSGSSLHPTRRIVGGSVLMVGGVIALGFGLNALLQNWQCLQSGEAVTAIPSCPQFLDSAGPGAALLASGIWGVVMGALIVGIPSRQRAAVTASWRPSLSASVGR